MSTDLVLKTKKATGTINKITSLLHASQAIERQLQLLENQKYFFDFAVSGKG